MLSVDDVVTFEREPHRVFAMVVDSFCTVCGVGLAMGELAAWLDDGDVAAGFVCATCLAEVA